jgi:hypothetical protein
MTVEISQTAKYQTCQAIFDYNQPNTAGHLVVVGEGKEQHLEVKKLNCVERFFAYFGLGKGALSNVAQFFKDKEISFYDLNNKNSHCLNVENLQALQTKLNHWFKHTQSKCLFWAKESALKNVSTVAVRLGQAIIQRKNNTIKLNDGNKNEEIGSHIVVPNEELKQNDFREKYSADLKTIKDLLKPSGSFLYGEIEDTSGAPKKYEIELRKDKLTGFLLPTCTDQEDLEDKTFRATKKQIHVICPLGKFTLSDDAKGILKRKQLALNEDFLYLKEGKKWQFISFKSFKFETQILSDESKKYIHTYEFPEEVNLRIELRFHQNKESATMTPFEYVITNKDGIVFS